MCECAHARAPSPSSASSGSAASLGLASAASAAVRAGRAAVTGGRRGGEARQLLEAGLGPHQVNQPLKVESLLKIRVLGFGGNVGWDLCSPTSLPP